MIGSCIKHIPIAGRDITYFVQSLLREREPNIPPQLSMETAKAVKGESRVAFNISMEVVSLINFWCLKTMVLIMSVHETITVHFTLIFKHYINKLIWIYSEYLTWHHLSSITEKFSYICPDIAKEFNKYDSDQGKWIKKYEGRNPVNNQTFSIDIGYERFLGPEIFFHPEVSFSILSKHFSLQLLFIYICCIYIEQM